MIDRLLSALVAVSLACLVWLYLRSRDPVTLDNVPLPRAYLTLLPRQQTYELVDVPVQFLCPPNFPLRPLFREERAGKITVCVLGPAEEEPPAVSAFIDLGGRTWEPGPHEEPVQLYLPKDFQVAPGGLRRVTFQLVPDPTATSTPEKPPARKPRL